MSTSLLQSLLACALRASVLALFAAFPACAQKASSNAGSASSLKTRVWVNASGGVYHCPGTKYYGNTKDGEFMSEAAARGSGYHAVGTKGCTTPSTGRAPFPDGTAPNAKLVWVNTESHTYHCPSDSSQYGLTKRGRYLTEAKAVAEKDAPAAGKKCW